MLREYANLLEYLFELKHVAASMLSVYSIKACASQMSCLQVSFMSALVIYRHPSGVKITPCGVSKGNIKAPCKHDANNVSHY